MNKIKVKIGVMKQDNIIVTKITNYWCIETKLFEDVAILKNFRKMIVLIYDPALCNCIDMIQLYAIVLSLILSILALFW